MRWAFVTTVSTAGGVWWCLVVSDECARDPKVDEHELPVMTSHLLHRSFTWKRFHPHHCSSIYHPPTIHHPSTYPSIHTSTYPNPSIYQSIYHPSSHPSTIHLPSSHHPSTHPSIYHHPSIQLSSIHPSPHPPTISTSLPGSSSCCGRWTVVK